MVLRRPKGTGNESRTTFSAGARPRTTLLSDGQADGPPLRPRVSNASTLSAAAARARPTTIYDAAAGSNAGAAADAGGMKRTMTQARLPKEPRDREKEVRAGSDERGDGSDRTGLGGLGGHAVRALTDREESVRFGR